MAVTIRCPNCDLSYSVADDDIGRRLRCKVCQAVFTAAIAQRNDPPVSESKPEPAATSPVAQPAKPVPRIPLAIWLVMLAGVFMSCVVLAVLLFILVVLWKKQDQPSVAVQAPMGRGGFGFGGGGFPPNLDNDPGDDEPNATPLKAPETQLLDMLPPSEVGPLEAPNPIGNSPLAAALAPRPVDLSIGTSRLKDGLTLAPVALRMLDPLNRISEVGIEIWTGDSSAKTRSPAQQEPKPAPGDSPVIRHKLVYQEHVGRAEIPLPALPMGKAYWIRPYWTDDQNRRTWATATVVSPERGAVASRAVNLAIKHQVGSRSLAVASWLSASIPERNNRLTKLSTDMATQGIENVQAIDLEEKAKVRWQLRAHKIDTRSDGKVIEPEPPLKKLREEVSNLAVNLQLNRQGAVAWHGLDTTRLTPPILVELDEWEQHAALVELMLPALPVKEVIPQESWRSERSWTLPVAGLPKERAALELVYTFRGTRMVDGREEAAVDIEGTLHAAKRHEDHLLGWLNGTAVIDLETGQTVRSELRIHWQLGVADSLIPATGTYFARLRRSIEL